MRQLNRWAVMFFALAPLLACDLEQPTDPTPPPLLDVMRLWRYSWTEVGAPEIIDGEWQSQLGGVVSDSRDWGAMNLYPPEMGPNATTEVYSDERGYTYWASAQAPGAQLSDTGSVFGTATDLEHFLWFRKDRDDAHLEFVVSGVLLDLIDGNGLGPTELECPSEAQEDDCRWIMRAEAIFSLAMYGEPNSDTAICSWELDPPCIFSIGGVAEVHGYRGTWDYDVDARTTTLERLWDASDFVWDPDVDDQTNGVGGHAQLRLREPLRIRVPVAVIETGSTFRVETSAAVFAMNHMQRESYVAAFLRDPVEADGLTVEYSGLTPVMGEPPAPGVPALDPPPVCTEGSPPQGTLEFADVDFTASERAGRARVEVRRSGGSAGAMSALLTTHDGTATSGSDYREVSTYVLFADGEEGTRSAIIPLIGDLEPEERESLQLRLAVADGCANIGPGASATLTILDDDWPPTPDPTYTIGGTVSGLLGTGLALTMNSTNEIEVGNGEFTFGRDFPNRLPYNVEVASQPTGPAQFCSVENGSGTIDGADITNVEISCGPPIGGAGLDPAFGDGGKVYEGLRGGATDMAIQPDGKIVVVGGQRVARYHPNGTPDESFGTGGEVTVDVFGSNDRLQTVAVQADGRIVTAGDTKDGVNSPTQEDWLIVRLHPDGTKDTSFGAGGHVVIDFDERGDVAENILLQPDGSIIVTGTGSSAVTGISDADFAAVRLGADGVVDTGFGVGGRVLVNIAGRSDHGYSSALQPDGKIVLAGRVADSGGADPDYGLLRLNPDGSRDDGFGEHGILRPETDGWDEIADVVVQPDGRIIVVGLAGSMIVSRFLSDGEFDRGFGAGGSVTDPRIAAGTALDLKEDGSIVAVGHQNGDFAISVIRPDGSPDSSFGDDGFLSVDFFGEADTPAAVRVLADGAILVGGYSTSGRVRSVGIAKVLP